MRCGVSDNPTQYYPTPPEAALPLVRRLRDVLAPGAPILDPCAGRGALPLWFGAAHTWDCFELLPAFKAGLLAIPQVRQVFCLNALTASWPPLAVVANPPYGRALGDFAARIAGHSRLHGVVGAMLSRVTWWGEGERSDLAPDVLLWLRGRISFTGDGRCDSSSHCWAIWLPVPRDVTAVEWVDRLAPDDAQVAQWRAMLGLEGYQMSLLSADVA